MEIQNKALEFEKEERLRAYYRTLAQAWGPQHWWPAHTRFEVITGAYLTQNTAWTNVKQALTALRRERLLRVEGIRDVPLEKLEQLIRPSGYFRQKASRLKNFVAYLDTKYAGSLSKMFSQPTSQLREELLGLPGVGRETADSILLYAGNHPVFVVDAYTRRILERHDIIGAEACYEEIRKLFQTALGPIVELQQRVDTNESPAQRKRYSITSNRLAAGLPGAVHPPSRMSTARRTALVQVYNEMHGLIVGVGKHYCKKSQPLCDGCPLQPFLPCRKKGTDGREFRESSN